MKLTDVALAAARLAGCNCEPDITVTAVEPGIYSSAIAHDEWCRLLLTRSAPWN